MKKTRSLMVLVALSVGVLVLSATALRGQVLETTLFEGTFTLPFNAQWGSVTVPAGDYMLKYGHMAVAGSYVVEIVGEGKGAVHGIVLSGVENDVSTTKNSLLCIREGDTLVVRDLELPSIGKSVRFLMPRGVQLMADKRNHSTYAQLEGKPMLIQRVPIEVRGK